MMLAVEPIVRRDGFPRPADILIDYRRALDEGATAGDEAQIAVGIELRRIESIQAHRDRIGVGARRNSQIVFEKMIPALAINQVDAGIDVAGLNRGINRDVAM